MSVRTPDLPPTSRSSQISSWLPMCAWSQTSGDISGECCLVSSSSSTAPVSHRVRSLALVSSAAMCSRSACSPSAAGSTLLSKVVMVLRLPCRQPVPDRFRDPPPG